MSDPATATTAAAATAATPVQVGAAAGASISLVKFFAAFVFVIGLMLVVAWLVKRAGFAGPILRAGQKRRLAVLESQAIDHRRRLVLVRRDGVEHLLLLGPDHALVVEGGIVPPAPAAAPVLPNGDVHAVS